jgi:hypothetical protein
MKKASIGVVSGCLVWILAIGIIDSCIAPVFMTIGSATSTTDFAIRTTGKFICPEQTTPKSNSYQSTRRDDYGNSRPTTAYELQCVDAGGEILQSDPVVYAFIWIGIIALIGLVLSSVLAFVLAAPAGVLITKWMNRNNKKDIAENVQPT